MAMYISYTLTKGRQAESVNFSEKFREIPQSSRNGVHVERIRQTKQATRRETETPEAPSAHAKDSEALKAELDELLDEIDDVLEENAEQFVADYVQKGGE